MYYLFSVLTYINTHVNITLGIFYIFLDDILKLVNYIRKSG